MLCNCNVRIPVNLMDTEGYFFFFVIRAWSICPGCTAAYEAYCATLIHPMI